MAKKGKRGTVKFKWTKELVILIVLLAGMLAATIIMAIPSEAAKRTAVYNDAITEFNTANQTQYDLLPEENVFKFADYDELKDIVAAKKEGYTYVVYGLMTDGTILGSLYEINLIAKDHEIETVLLYKADWVNEQEDLEAEGFKKELKERENALNVNNSVDAEKFTLLEYPTFVIYKDGAVVFNSQEYDGADYTWNQYIQKLVRFNAKYDAQK